ncbi:MAG TPA: NUDIX domain-containing protein [Orrella sp.]
MTTTRLQSLLRELQQQASQTPELGSIPLLIDDVHCGQLSPRAVEVFTRQKPSFLVDGQCRLATGPTFSTDLAELALGLYEQGCIPKWRDELLDVWCGNNVVGAIERGAVRPLGLLTRAVHLNAWSTRGELWVARRALNKPTDPGMWDTLVGGLVGHREPDDLALVRETQEEAGLSEADIVGRGPIRSIYRMQRRVNEGFQYEEVLTSDCVLADDAAPQNQDGEVMDIVCLPVADIEAMLFDGAFTLEASIVITESLLNRPAR